MLEPNIVKMEQELKELGLSEYEIKAYLTLVREGTLIGNKLSKLSNVPQGKIYATLYKLADKGFITMMDSKPKVFKANNPDIAINHSVKKRKERLEELETKLPKIIQSFSKLRSIEPKTDQKISVFFGKRNAFAPVWYLQENTKKSFDWMFTFETLQHKSWRNVLQMKKQGIKMRVISTKYKKNKLIKEFIKNGFDVRYYAVEEIRIFIRDREESLFMIVNPNDTFDRTNVLIQSKELSNALSHYFDTIWNKAKIIKL